MITVRSRGRTDALDVSDKVAEMVETGGLQNGICHVYVPHTTAGLLINENADPDALADLLRTLDRLVPWEAGYSHAEGNAAAHIKASLLGNSQTIPVREGRLALGRWQGIFLIEFDGPRERQLLVTLTTGAP